MIEVANLWWLWLGLFIFFMGYAVVNQVRRMNRMMTGGFEDGRTRFKKGLVRMVLASMLGMVFFILFVVAIAIQIVLVYKS